MLVGQLKSERVVGPTSVPVPVTCPLLPRVRVVKCGIPMKWWVYGMRVGVGIGCENGNQVHGAKGEQIVIVIRMSNDHWYQTGGGYGAAAG